jgi:hypothetical protein
MKKAHTQRGLSMSFQEFCAGLTKRARFLRTSRALRAREDRVARRQKARIRELPEVEPSEVELQELEIEEKEEE